VSALGYKVLGFRNRYISTAAERYCSFFHVGCVDLVNPGLEAGVHFFSGFGFFLVVILV
jgi:hypothetical protein